MDRLTLNDLNEVCYDPWELCEMDIFCKKGCYEEGGCRNGCHIIKMYRKLAEYEDLEEQGKFLKLPCAVGDTVYTNCSMQGWYFRKENKPYAAKVVFVGINGVDNYINVDFGNGHMLPFKFSDIGKTVFLTQKEAEAVLKELRSASKEK